ncbi:hypothetical protein KY285_036963 [Solanum tuberosum]|nr:hypothetical protein KY285_036963 [Solanum tuberosum]
MEYYCWFNHIIPRIPPQFPRTACCLRTSLFLITSLEGLVQTLTQAPADSQTSHTSSQEITTSAVSAYSKLSQEHQKQKCSSGMEENPNNQPAQQTTLDKNLRRRTRYAQMSPKRKQLLLSQLRAKRAESKTQKTLHQTNSTAALTITTSSLSPQQASKPTNVPSTSTRREHIPTCSSTFKQGSISAACHVAGKLPSPHSANKGCLLSCEICSWVTPKNVNIFALIVEPTIICSPSLHLDCVMIEN